MSKPRCTSSRTNHRWLPDARVGCAENPGVYSRGGTTLVIVHVCPHCSVRRTALHLGSQRNPGQRDTTVTYDAL